MKLKHETNHRFTHVKSLTSVMVFFFVGVALPHAAFAQEDWSVAFPKVAEPRLASPDSAGSGILIAPLNIVRRIEHERGRMRSNSVRPTYWKEGAIAGALAVILYTKEEWQKGEWLNVIVILSLVGGIVGALIGGAFPK